MAEAVYILCALTSLGCAVLLTRSYLRTRTRLLLWSSLFFVLIAGSNVLLLVDRMAVPSVDLSLVRSSTAFVSMVILVFGLIWESKS